MVWLLIVLILIPYNINAECAWLLWSKKIYFAKEIKKTEEIEEKNKTTEKIVKEMRERNKMTKSGEWEIDSAFDDMKKCINKMYLLDKSVREFCHDTKCYVSTPTPKITDNKMNYSVYYPDRSIMTKLECWPSNIKPE